MVAVKDCVRSIVSNTNSDWVKGPTVPNDAGEFLYVTMIEINATRLKCCWVSVDAD